MRGSILLAGASAVWLMAEAFSASVPEVNGAEEAAKDSSANSTPVVVELFTSEGCSSCPPADRLLIELQKSQPVAAARIIALSEHVDYWNRLGWTDPFSSAQFSARQNDYADAFFRDGVYTPQMVVDGQIEFVGSDRRRALAAIAKSAGARKAQVRITLAEGGETSQPRQVKLQVRVDGSDRTALRHRAEVWLAITEDDLSSNVASGENSGRRLQHVAVVRQFQSLGRIDPEKSQSFNADPQIALRPGWNREELKAVVFAQEERTRHILGAASLHL